MRTKRIGIYAGAFDPVNGGHIAFVLQSLKAAQLDEVVFLPERRPQNRPGIEHFAHRVAMIKRAIRPYKHMSVLELADRYFTVRRTLPQLQALFAGHELVFLMGSDAIQELPRWPYADRLLAQCGLVVGVRSEHLLEEVHLGIEGWQAQPRNLVVVPSYASDVSSKRIREALRVGAQAKGLLSSVSQYARSEWLYVSPAIVLAQAGRSS